jgi:hypothetical protein
MGQRSSKHKEPIKHENFIPADESLFKKEILDFVRSCGVEAQYDVAGVVPEYNVDVWVPEFKLAIECNNFYWHCETQITDKSYHQKKLEACQKGDICLFMIYEDEWRDKQDLIKDMIKHRVHQVTDTYFARKLEMRKLTVAERKEFFTASHLEGDVNSTVAFGLIDPNGRVVAAQSLRRAFHKRYKEFFEIGRSASRPTCHVNGWIGKLTKACFEYAVENGKQGLVTYVDSRVGEGKAYLEAGFEVSNKSTGPRLWWTDFVNKFNRFQFKADLPNGRNQKQVVIDAGVVALWGVSNKLMTMKKKENIVEINE